MYRPNRLSLYGVILTVISTSSLARDYDSASFDCSRATTKVEKLICDNPDLSNVDKRLGEVYVRMQKSLSKAEIDRLKKEQREWLKQRDEKLLECGTETDCAVQFYESRIAELESSKKPMSADSSSSTKPSSAGNVYGVITTESTELNVRQGMGTDTTIIGKAKKGAKIRILETLGTWHKVQLENGKVGYVSSDFIKILDQEPSAPAKSATDDEDSDSTGLLSASFNCAKASSPVEKLICNNPQLSDADGRLGDLYANLQKSLSASESGQLKEGQKTWLKQRDKKLLNCGTDMDCAVQVYEDRITELATAAH